MLREYQAELIRKIRESARRGNKRILVQAPCGAGKTVMFSNLAARAIGKDKGVLVIAPRRELVRQASEKFRAFDLEHAIAMRGHPEIDHPVQVASAQTLMARRYYPEADLCVVDEAHLAGSPGQKRLLDRYNYVIGFTATPARKDGYGLGEVFDDLIVGPSPQELIDQGYLVQPEYYVGVVPDLKGVTTNGGDYNLNELGKRMDPLIGDAVEQWLRVGENRSTVAFTATVANSLKLRDRFIEAGISAEHLDGDTPSDERAQIFERVRSGETKIVTNCATLTLGWDEPSVSCVILYRPTRSLVLYLQLVGRVLRPHPGKDKCLVLDHAGAIYTHGFVEDPKEWTLDRFEKVKPRQLKLTEPKIIECKECGFVYQRAQKCPKCGWVPPAVKKSPTVIDGELHKVDRWRKVKPQQWPEQARTRFFAELKGYAIEKGYKVGWAYHKYQEKFHAKPESEPSAATPSEATRAWVKSRNIARAKARAKENAGDTQRAASGG